MFALVMAAYSWALASLLNALLRTFTTIAAPTSPVARLLSAYSSWVQLVAMFVVTPVVISLIVLALVELLRLTGLSARLQVLGASIALFAGATFSSLAWAVVVAPVFFLGAFAYVYWRKTSLPKAFAVTVLIQAFHNLIPAIRAVYDQTH